MSGVPVHISTSGWVPFFVVICIILIFSTFYIFWYRDPKKGYFGPVISVLAFSVVLMASALIPVDVFVVSMMKSSNGSFEEWASTTTAREMAENMVMEAYYSLYGVVLFFAFVLLPFAIFYEGDNVEASLRYRIFRGLLFTSIFAAVFVILLLLGEYLPLFADDKTHKGLRLIVFAVNVLNLLGMMFIVLYTGYGFSSFPIQMIYTESSVIDIQRNLLKAQVDELEERIDDERENCIFRDIPESERTNLHRLERQLRILVRTDRDLEQSARHCLHRVSRCLRPFAVLFGGFFGICGFLIFLSLLISCIDKGMHSDMNSGYFLITTSLFNPLDFILGYAQVLFPLDYIIYTGIVLFFIFCTVSGIQAIGIRFLWVSIYDIRAGKTSTKALGIMCLILTYIILTMNVVMHSIAPDYTTYGSQCYFDDHEIISCGDKSNHDLCIMTRISVLIRHFYVKIWFFGAMYYWSECAFLIAIVIGSFVSFYRVRARRRLSRINDDTDVLVDNTVPHPIEY